MEKKYIIPHKHKIGKEDRSAQKDHKPAILWFTGLSGSGKSTLANLIEQKLFNQGLNTYILDGDNVREGLNSDLDFSSDSRTENIRRIGEVAKLFVDAGMVVLSAFISPFIEDRQKVRSLVSNGEFFEIYVECPLEVCEARDVKGLYKKARAGEISNFTGISSPFEEPVWPEVKVNTATMSKEECLRIIMDAILNKLKK